MDMTANGNSLSYLTQMARDIDGLKMPVRGVSGERQ